MNRPDDSPTIVGRPTQWAALTGALAKHPADGQAHFLVGTAGIGKTTLLRAGETFARATGFTVLRCTGLPNDMPLGFDNLHELLHPVLDRTAGLAPRQRDALRAAFGELTQVTPDRFAMKSAVLGLLQDLAAEQPVALFVDDWQWLDPSTADVMAYVAQELGTAPIVLVATVRTETVEAVRTVATVPVTAEVIEVGPLEHGDAGALLDALPAGPTGASREKVLELAEGNPLALIELAGALPADATDPAAPLPLSARLERSFLQELQLQGPGARSLLLCAAAGVDLSTPELMRAGQRLGSAESDLQAVRRSGLVSTTGDHLAFRHPLVRSAVYSTALLSERLAVHRALAETLSHPDRSVWHRAAATVGTDDAVAAQLVAVAGRSAARGALAESVVALRRAADLSSQGEDRARYLGEAAEAARRAGLGDTVVTLIEQARRIATQPSTLVRIASTDAGNSAAYGIGSHSAQGLLSLVRQLVGPDGDANIQPRLLLLWCVAGLAVLYRQPREVLETTAAELNRLPLDADDPVRNLSLAMLDPLTWAPTVRPQLPSILPLVGNEPGQLSKILLSFGWAATALQDIPQAIAGFRISVEELRRTGRAGDQARELAFLASLRVVTGDLDRARSEAQTARRTASALNLPMAEAEAHAVLALSHAWHGEAEAVRTALEQSRRAAANPWISTQALIGWASGLDALARRNYREAWIALQATAAHPTIALWTVADQAEAASRSGKTGAAASLVEEAERSATVFGSDHLWSLTARARAVLDETTDAEKHFERSLEHARLAPTPLEAARTHLAYGRWLRRQRLVARARDQLAAAFEVFDRAGARPWADQAAEELRAAGGLPAQPRRPGAELLTPQELQVAELAATGLSNKEIADRLYLSHRTVSTHLYRATDKLGGVQRAQLRELFPALRASTGEP